LKYSELFLDNEIDARIFAESITPIILENIPIIEVKRIVHEINKISLYPYTNHAILFSEKHFSKGYRFLKNSIKEIYEDELFKRQEILDKTKADIKEFVFKYFK